MVQHLGYWYGHILLVTGEKRNRVGACQLLRRHVMCGLCKQDVLCVL
jgi:hypothetical protein